MPRFVDAASRRRIEPGATAEEVKITMLDTIGYPALFFPWFRKPSTWSAWRVLLAILFGLPVAANVALLLKRIDVVTIRAVEERAH